MKLTPDQIKEIILKPKARDLIALALRLQRKHKLHVCGEGYDDWLKEFHSVESKRTIAKKAKLCRPKTPGIYKQIKIQYEKVFRAKGNVVNYNIKGDDKKKKKMFLEHLRTCANGMSLTEYMSQIWHDSMFQEFNGFSAIELKPKEELKNLNAKTELPVVTLYPLEVIHDFDQKGYELQYIAIKVKIKVAGEERDAYRIVDEEKDGIYYVESDKLIIHKREDGSDDVLPMIFKKIPFIQNSRYRFSPSDHIVKNSPVGITMNDADLYLSISDDHIVSVKAHQHPIFFSFPAMCGVCQGTGNKYNKEGEVEGMCGTCFGRKEVNILKTDISEGFTLPRVESDDGTTEAAQPPCGYVTPDLASLAEQRVEMQEQKKAIERGALGIEGLLTVVESGEKETAFKAELDMQPIYDSLNPYSRNGEQVEEFLTDRMGEVMFKESWLGSHIHWGRKYFLRSETDIMNELATANTAGVPRTYIPELLEELYWVRFSGNPKAREFALLMLEIEPLPEWNIVSDLLGLKPFITEEKLIIKANINDYIEQLKNEFSELLKYDDDGNFDKVKSVELIKQKLKEYAKTDQTSITASETAKAERQAKSNGNGGAVGKKP